MQQSQSNDLAGPEVGFGVFGDGTQLLIDLAEQRRDKLHGDHAALLSWERCHVHSMKEAYDDCKPKNLVVHFYVAAVVKPLSTYFFPFLFWGRCPLVQSRLATLVSTQLPYGQKTHAAFRS